jgi:peptidoglycan/LPS O-acetylase OafA/YrhL
MFPFISDNQKAFTSPAPDDGRLPLLVALRAIAALIIVWHHFAIYPPLRAWAAPLVGDVLDWLAVHARTTQVFFVIGGYVMARTMNDGHWDRQRVGNFLKQRYFRLGLPYLGAIALVIPIATFARGWVPDEVLGEPVTLAQMLAHLFFLQDILGYEQLSAGLWFVCINIQLCVLYAASLWLRDSIGQRRVDFVGIIGWSLAILSLFYLNLDASWDRWAVYFLPYFFMGTIVHRALRSNGPRIEFWLYLALLVVATGIEWRWRLAVAGALGLLLFAAEGNGFSARWPRNGLIARLGEVSFSLFLVHFPMLLLVSAIWARLEWTSPAAAICGLLTAFLASVAAAFAFHRWIETPAARLARRRHGHAPKVLPGAAGPRTQAA